MATNTSGTVSIPPLSPLAKYVGLIAALVAVLVLSFVVNVLPNTWGLDAFVAFFPTLFYFFLHDLETVAAPNGIPSYATFLVIAGVSAAEGLVGQFALQSTVVTVAAGVAFVIALLAAIVHTVAEDQGASAPAYVENWITAGGGLALAVLTYWQGHPGASAAAIVATLISIFPQYIHVSTDGASTTIAPVPQPAPSS
jgi:hypothetical protein